MSFKPVYEASKQKIKKKFSRQKVIEELIKRSENQFQYLFEKAPIPYFMIRPDGNVYTCNRQTEKLFGRKAEELTGRSLLEFVADTHDTEENKAKLLSSFPIVDTIQDLELQIQRADGTYIWISLDGKPMFDDHAGISAIWCTATDISKQREIDLITQARERLFQFAVKHSLYEVLEETLNEVEKLTGSLIGFYHFVDPDEKSLILQNWSTRTKKEFCKAEGEGSHYDIADAGVWVDCVCQRKPIIYNDYESLPHKKGFPPGHAPVTRFLVVPVMRVNRIMALLGIGNKPTDYSKHDLKIVSLFADLAWDIGGLMRVEEELRESERKYRNLVENINDVIFSADKNGVVTYISPSIAQMSGYTPAEIIGLSFSKFLVIGDWPDILNQFERVMSGVIEKSEYRIRTKSGEVRWVRSSIRPILEGDFPIGLQGIMTDITDRKLVEEELRKSETMLRSAQKITNIGSWEFDLVSNRLTWSDEAYRIFGLEPQEYEVSFKKFLEIIHADDRVAVEAAFSDSIRDGQEGYEISHRIVRVASGEIRFIEQKCIHHRDESGKVSYSIGTIHDITDREEAKKLRRITRELQTFNEAMLNREERIIELKTEVNRLSQELGRDTPYETVWDAEIFSKDSDHA